MGMEHVHHFNEVTVAIGEGEEHEHHPGQEEEAFKVWISGLIGVAAIAIALVVWASGVLGNHSAAQDADGITAAVKDQQAIVSSKISAIGDHTGYLAYRRNNLEGDLIANYLAPLGSGRLAPAYDALRRQMTQSWDVGVGINTFFTQRWSHIDYDDKGPVESYDSDRQFMASVADARERNDLDSREHIDAAQQQREKGLDLLRTVPFFGASIWLWTLAYDANKRVRLFPSGFACLIFAAAAGWALYVYLIR
jgi:hypothetical protein